MQEIDAVMIEYIQGKYDDVQPTTVIVEAGGVGYEVNITLIDYEKLHTQTSGRLYIHEAIRDDARVLFGFIERESRELFRLLITVSGVGPNTARLILSAMTATQLRSAIATGSDATLKAVKGIGSKTAQRIIVDLRDKIKDTPATLSIGVSASMANYDEALAALTTLGFAPSASQKVLRKLYDRQPELSVEQAVRMALKMM